MNKISNEEIILKLLKKNNLSITDLDFANNLYEIIGYYSFDLIKRLESDLPVKRDIQFIEDLILEKNNEIQNAIEIDLLGNLKTELSMEHTIQRFLSRSIIIKNSFNSIT